MFVIIPAAGFGQRFSHQIPKQYHLLDGEPILSRTLKRFLHHSLVEHVLVALSPTDSHFGTLEMTDEKLSLCVGGNSRAESVFAALKYGLEHQLVRETDIVAVHDAVRPLFADDLLQALFEAASTHCGGAIAATPATDTIKRKVPGLANPPEIAETISRDSIWLAQTPQVFLVSTLLAAFEAANSVNQLATITDEASAVEQFTCWQPRLVESSASNIKITRPIDLPIAEAILHVMQQESA